MPPISPVTAFLFDLDNTLLDRTQTFRAFAKAFAVRYFPDLPEEKRGELVRHIIDEDQDGYRSKPELFRQLRNELPFAPHVTPEELMAFYLEEYVTNAVPMEGAEELLDLARRKGLRIGLVTNGLHRVQAGKLRRLGWESKFDAVLISESAGCKKPDSAIFRKALEAIGADPAETVFVGDHPRNDILGAAEAGMRGIWLRRNQPWPEGAESAMLSFVHLHELIQWLERKPDVANSEQSSEARNASPDHDRVYAEEAEKYERLIEREDYMRNIPAAIAGIVDLTDRDVADLGAGTGRLSLMAAPYAKSLVAFDQSEAMLDVLAARLKREGYANWRTKTADHRSLPLPDDAVDIAMAGWTLCYLASTNVPDWERNLDRMQQELGRIVRPGGTILIFETLGTGHETPAPPNFLLSYHEELEKQYGYERVELRTDYRFQSLEEAEELARFFFGGELAEQVKRNRWQVLPECTGLWWKRVR